MAGVRAVIAVLAMLVFGTSLASAQAQSRRALPARASAYHTIELLTQSWLMPWPGTPGTQRPLPGPSQELCQAPAQEAGSTVDFGDVGVWSPNGVVTVRAFRVRIPGAFWPPHEVIFSGGDGFASAGGSAWASNYAGSCHLRWIALVPYTAGAKQATLAWLPFGTVIVRLNGVGGVAPPPPASPRPPYLSVDYSRSSVACDVDVPGYALRTPGSVPITVRNGNRIAVSVTVSTTNGATHRLVSPPALVVAYGVLKPHGSLALRAALPTPGQSLTVTCNAGDAKAILTNAVVRPVFIAGGVSLEDVDALLTLKRGYDWSGLMNLTLARIARSAPRVVAALGRWAANPAGRAWAARFSRTNRLVLVAKLGVTVSQTIGTYAAFVASHSTRSVVVMTTRAAS
jgi:hypothetical protein